MAHILAINGSYRPDGVTDRIVAAMTAALEARGASVSHIRLRDCQIGFCHNCRHCMQEPGDEPGACVQHDDMTAIVAALEAADGLIFAAPTNMGSVTAIFKIFLERLAVYGYWPPERHAPVERKARLRVKKAVLVSSSAAPGFMARFVYASMGQLQMAARLVGAATVGRLSYGPVGAATPVQVPATALAKAEKLARRLV